MKHPKQRHVLRLLLALLILIIVSLEGMFGWGTMSVGMITTAATTATRSSTTKKNKDMIVVPRNDGCGLTDTAEPVWVDYSPEDYDLLRRTQDCLNRFMPRSKWPDRSQFNLTKLACAHQVTQGSLQDLRSVIRHYRRIWFMGDSTMEHMYLTITCMLNENATRDNMYYTDHNRWTTSFYPLETNITSHDDHHVQYNDTDSDDDDDSKTMIRYSKIGLLFDRTNFRLMTEAMPHAMQTFRDKKDAIIAHAAHHYHLPNAHLLREAASYVADQSQHTNASVFWLEADEEQWPSTNGMFMDKCMWVCNCRALSPAQISGLAVPVPADLAAAIQRGGAGPGPGPTWHDLGQAIPQLFDNDQNLLPAYQLPSCVPDCAPANWRNLVARPLLQTNTSRVRIVPLWKQLVARQMVHSRMNGDCTHKSVDAYIAMIYQTIRSLADAIVENDENDSNEESSL